MKNEIAALSYPADFQLAFAVGFPRPYGTPLVCRIGSVGIPDAEKSFMLPSMSSKVSADVRRSIAELNSRVHSMLYHNYGTSFSTGSPKKGREEKPAGSQMIEIIQKERRG